MVPGKFRVNLEISEAFSMSLEISLSCICLRLGFSNFDQNHEKIVYLI